MKYALTTLAALLLGACTGPLSDAPNATGAAFTDAFADTPFEDGAAVTVLVRDTDPLRTIQSFKLVPCQGGKAVCGGSSSGAAGVLTLEGGQYVVRGAYAGRDFYLDRNGDGFMGRGSVLTPLAWN
ncbi:hypothetical protein [Loktanella sp. R86503]|uniref:hypothetical protein n=1 Tax=Loktanella TaxID=245186 RepID=UPI0036D8A116